MSDTTFARVSLSVAVVLSLVACSGRSDRPADSTTTATPAPATGTASAASCNSSGSPTITSDGIGPVRLGQALSDLRAACAVRDTSLRVDEGQRAVAVVVAINQGNVIAFADSAAGAIARIVTYDSVYKTSSGIGVGATIAKLRAAHPGFCAGIGATGVDAWTSSAANVVFATSGRPRVSESGNTAAALPGDAVVTGVVVAHNALAPCAG